MTSHDESPRDDPPPRGGDERIRDEATIGQEQPAPGDATGLEQRFEQEATEGVEAAGRDAASLEREAAALREEAATLDRQVPGPDAGA